MPDIKLLKNLTSGDLALSADGLPDRLILPATISLEQSQIDIGYDLVSTSGGAVTTGKRTHTGGLGFSGGFGGETRADTVAAITTLKKYLKADNVQLHYLDTETLHFIQPRQPTFRLPRGLKICEFSVRAVTTPSEYFARFPLITLGNLVNGGTVQVEAKGNEKMYPTIKITATSNISILNINSLANGKNFDVTAPLVTSDVLILDCENLTARLNDSGVLNHIGPSFRDDFPILEGANSIVFTFTGSANIEITHRNKWA